MKRLVFAMLLGPFACGLAHVDLGDDATSGGTSAAGGAHAVGGAGGGGASGSGGAGGARHVRSVVAGGHHSCAILEDGRVKCWGSNAFGQLATDPASSESCSGTPCAQYAQTAPLPVDLRALALGGDHACLIDAKGTVLCWGRNAFGELGRGIADPDPHADLVPVALPRPAKGLALGRHHSCARLDDGTVHCWGLDHAAQLGIAPTSAGACPLGSTDALELGLAPATTSVACVTSPAAIAGLSGASELWSGAFDGCARDGGGALRCWGSDGSGELGDGNAKPFAAAPVTSKLGATSALALGSTQSCALTAASKVLCWGAADAGQLGVGHASVGSCGADAHPCSLSALPLPDVAAASAIALGDAYGCAIEPPGGVVCWGSNAEGQLGTSQMQLETCATATGDAPCSTRPVAPSDLAGVIQLAAGARHACALHANGDVQCWGRNAECEAGGPGFGQIVTFPELVSHLD